MLLHRLVFKSTRIAAAVVLGNLCICPAIAESLNSSAYSPDRITSEQLGMPLSYHELGELRGGFTSEDGLHFAFTFDSVTKVNGEVLSHTGVQVPIFNLAHSETGTTSLLPSQSMINISSGFDSISGAHQVGTMLSPVALQNSFNNQIIETMTVLDLQVYGAGILGGTSTHSAMLPTLVASLKQ